MASRGKNAKKSVRKTSGLITSFWMFIAHSLGGAIRFMFRGAKELDPAHRGWNWFIAYCFGACERIWCLDAIR